MGGGEESSILSLSKLPVPKAVMLGQLTPAQFSALAQMLMESVLEGLISVIANNFLHIFHTGCVALFRPQWDCFSYLKNPQNNKNHHIVLGEEQQQHCPTALPTGLPTFALPTPTPPSPLHKHGAGKRQPGSPITLEKPRLEENHC